MSRQVRHGIQKFEEFDLQKFSTVDRGQKSYVIRSFAYDEEESVQDSFLASNAEEPETIHTKEDEITDEYYLPPSKLLKAEHVVASKVVNMLKPRPGNDGFVEHSEFSDAEENTEDFPKKVLKSEPDSGINSVKGAEMQLEIDNLKLKLTEYETKISEFEIALSEKDALIKAQDDEALAVTNSIPELTDKAKAEGDIAGYERGRLECLKNYEAQKDDYIKRVESFNKDSVAKLSEISTIVKGLDEQITDIVLGFVKNIVGAERKVNDKFVVSLIKNNLDRLNELKNVSFVVNPADIDVVKNELADYNVTPDTSIEKGSVKVITKVGEVNLDVKIMIADLERQLNQEIASLKNS